MQTARRLAAILAADVAGYSRLIGADEEGTLERLRALRREPIDPAIREHHGRIVKTTGDGLLIEFASVVDAVRCAIAIQRGMTRRNTEVSPEKRIEFRIGINLGDVVAEGEDLLGDGVNVAARLEGIAEPGGICLSRAAYDQARGKIDLAAQDLGERKLKNIAEPVRVFKIDLRDGRGDARAHSRDRTARLAAAVGVIIVVLAAVGIAAWYLRVGAVRNPAPLQTIAASQTTSAPRLSIVVLPFANLSADPAQEYLADVITEELTTSLSRISGSFVVARSTAFTYKGKPIDVKQVGRDLGVRYVLEGSEEPSGSRVRVSAQLIDAETGAHLWADRFDANRADLLAMQDEIVERLSGPLELRLVDVDATRVARTPAGNRDAQDLASQCFAGVFTSPLLTEAHNPAFGFCERALQIDNRNVIALTFVSLKTLTPVMDIQSTDAKAAIRQADELVSRALAIDRNFYWAHLVKGYVLVAQKRFEEAIAELDQTLALSPSFVACYAILCEANNFQGRPEQCIEYADKAIRLSPRDPLLAQFYGEKAWALLMLQRDDQAIEWERRALTMAPEVSITQALLASALALTGRQAEAREALQRYLSLKDTTSKTIAQFRPQHRSFSDNPKWLAYSDRLIEGLRRAGMPED
jgi:TolB-like protein/class 3 adenylate cyclase/Tfp pilus assembly protein PilF